MIDQSRCRDIYEELAGRVVQMEGCLHCHLMLFDNVAIHYVFQFKCALTEISVPARLWTLSTSLQVGSNDLKQFHLKICDPGRDDPATSTPPVMITAEG
jgi:hypothetical protein